MSVLLPIKGMMKADQTAQKPEPVTLRFAKSS